MNLYELTGQFLELQEMLEDPEIDSQLLADTMEALEGEIEWKADNYAKVFRNMEGSIEAIKKEQEKLAQKKAILECSIKRLKDNLEQCMRATGKTKFKTDLFSFNIQKNGGAMPVILDVDVEKLPDELVVVTERPDLKAIAKYIEETGDVTYAHFGERGESLRIK